MSYQVIARKWRPQTFVDVTGQEAITRTLQNAIAHQRLHHAYLFAGARGVGKTTTARLLAKALNCHQGLTAEPCNSCPSCTEIAAGTSLDVHEIDAASNTGVDNVREVIISNVSLSPARDRYKVFIIDEVHMLSTSAFNALLKTLEEPPGHVIFIMATTELHKVPETILSRCQQFEFRTIAPQKIADRLKLIAHSEGITISETALALIARAGEGSMRDAQSAFDQVISFAGQEITDEDVAAALGIIGTQTLNAFVAAIASRDARTVLLLVDELVSRGYDLRNFTRELMGHFRNLLVVRSVGFDREIVAATESEAGELKRLADYFSEEDLVRCFNVLTKVEQDIKTTTQERFQLELGLLKLVQLARLQSLEELLERVRQLEASVAGGSAPVNPAPPSRPAPPTRSAPASTSSQADLPPALQPVPQKGTAPAKAEPRGVPPVSQPKAEVPPVASRLSAVMPVPPVEVTPESLPAPAPAAPELAVVPPPAAVETLASGSEPLSGNDIADRMRLLLEERKKMFVLTAFDAAQSVDLVGDELRLVFAPKAKLFGEKLNSRDSQSLLEEIASEVCGRRITIKVVGGGSPPPAQTPRIAAAGTAEGSAKPGAKKSPRERASADPIVQAFVKTFRGQIVDVKTADNEDS